MECDWSSDVCSSDLCFFSDFIVHEGEYVSHNGVRIELEFSDEDLDYVRIASKPN